MPLCGTFVEDCTKRLCKGVCCHDAVYAIRSQQSSMFSCTPGMQKKPLVDSPCTRQKREGERLTQSSIGMTTFDLTSTRVHSVKEPTLSPPPRRLSNCLIILNQRSHTRFVDDGVLLLCFWINKHFEESIFRLRFPPFLKGKQGKEKWSKKRTRHTNNSTTTTADTNTNNVLKK